MGRPIPFKTNDRIRCRQGKGDMNVEDDISLQIVTSAANECYICVYIYMHMYMHIDNVPSSMLFA